jgi:hypothetical protein
VELDFVGIAAPRSGSTWLRSLLQTHPEIYIPQMRKEIHFFDRYFERGEDWYGQFFRDVDRSVHRSVGEFTPHYLYSPDAPRRIAEAGVPRLLMVLRDPVSRTVSHYRFRQQVDAYKGSLSDFVVDFPESLEWGDYAAGLERYLDHFDITQLLILTAEEAQHDPARALNRVGSFLGVGAEGFRPDAVEAHERNSSGMPRSRVMYNAAHRTAAWLRDRDMYWLPQLARRLGVGRRLVQGSPREAVHPSPETLTWLTAHFEPSVCRLEELTGLDLAMWREET